MSWATATSSRKNQAGLFLKKETYTLTESKGYLKMDYIFNVEFLEPVLEFLENLDPKSREKILYNIWKSRSINDSELFKKLDGEIWDFRTLYNKQYLRLFAFWDKSDKNPKVEIERAESLRVKYFNEKK